MRPILALVLFLALSPAATADIVAVRFKTPKIANRFKEHVIVRNGEAMLVGEHLKTEPGGVSVGYGGAPGETKPPVEVIVTDPADPTKVPYKWEGDKRVFAKKTVIAVAQDDVAGVMVLVQGGTIASMAGDYVDRQRQVDELIAARNACTKGTPEWQAAQQRALTHIERLVSWLDSTLYPETARKLEKTLAKERKLSTESTAARLEAARASIKVVDTPAELVAASKAVSGGMDVFHVAESLHVRIVYVEAIGDDRIRGLLDFAETVIDGFRVEFVDPYLDAAYEDHIPERIFGEYWFGPDDVGRHERYLTEYYKREWGQHKAKLLESAGSMFRRAQAPEFLEYWRYSEERDLDGIIAHLTGHELANIHYDRLRLGAEQDWLSEALGFYLTFDWLGHNSVTCGSFSEPGKAGLYGKKEPDKKEGQKTMQIGLRDYYNALALERGPPIEKLALKTLFELDDADFAKSWSFFDYLAHKEGKNAQLFLRAACNTSRTKDTFIKDWRSRSEEIFEAHGKDVFDLLETRWREYAQSGQEKGDAKRK